MLLWRKGQGSDPFSEDVWKSNTHENLSQWIKPALAGFAGALYRVYVPTIPALCLITAARFIPLASRTPVARDAMFSWSGRLFFS